MLLDWCKRCHGFLLSFVLLCVLQKLHLTLEVEGLRLFRLLDLNQAFSVVL